MSRHQTIRRFVQFLMTFTAGLLLFAASALAQLQTGNIVGTVTDATGAALPGVTVTVKGIAAPQVEITNAQGEFRVLNLSPGTYALQAQLEGFSATQRSIDVTVGHNSEIHITLSTRVNEDITVTAATPIIDRRQTGTAVNVEQVELLNVPTARDPWVVLQSVPGVLVDRVNVGGNKSGQQSYFVGKGVERHQTAWNLDGVNVTDMETTGSSAFYYDFESFQELNISTGSADPSVQTPGVQINMVTKRGTNDLTGSAHGFFTSHNLQTSPRIPAEGADYDPPLVTVNSINRINEEGVDAGGPLVRDKLWLWGAYAQNDINNVLSGTTQYQKTTLKNWNAKLNAQLTPQNSGSLYYMFSNKVELGRGASINRPPETTVDQTGPGYVLKLEDTQQFTQNFYLTPKFGYIKNGYEQTPRGGLDTTVYWDDEAGTPHGSYKYFKQDVPQKNARADGAAFLHTGNISHELHFGFGYRSTPVKSITAWPGNGTFTNIYEDDPESDSVAITRNALPDYTSNYRDLYIGDTVPVGAFLFTGGLRYDLQRAKNNPSTDTANPAFPEILPAVAFAGDERSLEWKSVQPRFGVTWSPDSGKSIVRGSYSRYMDQLGSSDVGPGNPFFYVQTLYYPWMDANGDNLAQRGEIDFSDGPIDWLHIDPDHPSSGFSTTRVDYSQKPTMTDELMLGVQREVMPAFALGANLTWRKRTDFVMNRYEKTRGAGDYYTTADFEPASTVTGTLPNGQTYTVPYYKLKAGVPAPIYTVATNRPDYYQTYKGLELTATKRMEHHWMLRANVTLQDWKQHVGPNGFTDPTQLLEEDSCTSCNGAQVASNGGEDGYINSKWSFSMNGVYQFPWQISFGAALVGRQGYIIPYYRRVNARDGFGNKRVLVDGFDSQRLDNLYNLDLRLAKELTVRNGVSVTLSADLFNATNTNTVLWRDNRLYTSDGPDVSSGNNNIIEQQSPRVWRLGARLTF
jgi:hypothetical protein